MYRSTSKAVLHLISLITQCKMRKVIRERNAQTPKHEKFRLGITVVWKIALGWLGRAAVNAKLRKSHGWSVR